MGGFDEAFRDLLGDPNVDLEISELDIGASSAARSGGGGNLALPPRSGPASGRKRRPAKTAFPCGSGGGPSRKSGVMPSSLCGEGVNQRNCGTACAFGRYGNAQAPAIPRSRAEGSRNPTRLLCGRGDTPRRKDFTASPARMMSATSARDSLAGRYDNTN